MRVFLCSSPQNLLAFDFFRANGNCNGVMATSMAKEMVYVVLVVAEFTSSVVMTMVKSKAITMATEYAGGVLVLPCWRSSR